MCDGNEYESKCAYCALTDSALGSDILSAACTDQSLISLAGPQPFIQESEKGERESERHPCSPDVISYVSVTAS